MNATLQKAIATKNVKVIADLSYKYPELLVQTNDKGETPLRAYLNGGGRNRGMIVNLTPSFQPDWTQPTWYGLPGAWTHAGW